MQQWQLDKRAIAKARAARANGKPPPPEPAKPAPTPRVARGPRGGGPAGVAYGASNERVLYNVARNLMAELPWIEWITKATAKQDAAGIDLVVRTALGTVYLQSKSSVPEARRWRRYHKHLLSVARAVVVTPNDMPRTIARTRAALTELYTLQQEAKPHGKP